MVGFARAFSDGGSAYLADVYVLPGHRGAGLGKAIVRMMVETGPGPGLRWMLHTADAHGLYRPLGFTRPDGDYLERAVLARRPGRPARPKPPKGPAGRGLPEGPAGRGLPEGPAGRGLPERPAGRGLPEGPGRSGGEGGSRPGPGESPGVVPPGLTLVGELVRLEPLRARHVRGLETAAAGGAELYRWSPVPQDEAGCRRYVETALAARDGGTAVPFAVIRAEDDAVIGSTRFFDLDYWPWPDSHHRTGPDTCEIGYTWLSRDAIRTGANTEMKRLMLTHAFEIWQVRSVCLHTDARNQRSRDAMARIGARYEGILRAHRLGADLTPRDSARFSITAAEWPAVRRHLDELGRRYQRS